MRFANIFSFFRTLRKPAPRLTKEQLAMRYNRDVLRIARLIIDDSEKGYVTFILNGEASQVQCDFQWFADVTEGGDDERVIILRHCLLAALNIMLGFHGQQGITEDTPLPVFLMLDEEPCMQYLFYGKTGVRCERYDSDIAEAIAAYEEYQKEKANKTNEA